MAPIKKNNPLKKKKISGENPHHSICKMTKADI